MTGAPISNDDNYFISDFTQKLYIYYIDCILLDFCFRNFILKKKNENEYENTPPITHKLLRMSVKNKIAQYVLKERKKDALKNIYLF